MTDDNKEFPFPKELKPFTYGRFFKNCFVYNHWSDIGDYYKVIYFPDRNKPPYYIDMEKLKYFFTNYLMIEKQQYIFLKKLIKSGIDKQFIKPLKAWLLRKINRNIKSDIEYQHYRKDQKPNLRAFNLELKRCVKDDSNFENIENIMSFMDIPKTDNY